MSEPQIEILDLKARDTIWYVWQALPWDVKERLNGVTIKASAAGYHAPGSAGSSDVQLRLPLPHNLDRQIVAHELAHVFGRHLDRVARGEISEAQAETEAKRLAASWGF